MNSAIGAIHLADEGVISLPPASVQGAEARRTASLFRRSQRHNHIETDRLFATLMIVQWMAGIFIAVCVSPKVWHDAFHQKQLWHVWTAVFLGGAISGVPVLLAWQHPGRVVTRHAIAVSQMLTSALLIHLTGGRLETHFHIFGSLTFLAFYRDWRVLLTATIVMFIDHAVRGTYWPQSIFGEAAAQWRWMEHVGWILIEDVILYIAIRQNLTETLEVARRRSRLEGINKEIERQVQQRTRELTEAHKQLVETSRQAGMAEIATNVLHNVGNVLNSVNVSAESVAGKVRHFRITSLKQVAELLREHADNLPEFLTQDPRGKELPSYLVRLAENLAEPQQAILQELVSLQKNIEHIKEVVAMQQSYARRSGMLETLSAVELVEAAIHINNDTFTRHGVDLIRDYHDVPPVLGDRHKVLPILVNLLTNAKHALVDSEGDRRLVIQVTTNDSEGVEIKVMDNGVGIAPENLTRIFQHGFTTRENGHGFGLHSGALAAREMGGRLTVQSDGVGRGAAFTLQLPLQQTQTS
ncbi:MAG: sensor histidine kinase [Prosthecobacter sp.]